MANQLLRIMRFAIPTGLGLWLILNAFAHPKLFLTMSLLGLSNGMIYALVGMGFALIYEISKVLNFAHGDIFMLGAVGSTWLLVDVIGAQSPTFSNWLFLAGVILLALAFGAMVGALMEKVIFERLLETNVLTPLIASIGLSFILQNLGLKWNGSGKKKFETVFPDSSPYIDFESVLSRTPLVSGLAVPILLFAILLMKYLPFGRAIRASSEDPKAAQLCGVNVKQATTFAYALAGALASAGGVIYAQESAVVNYDLGRTIGLVALASAIIGGIGTLGGAIVGGISVGLIESLSIGLPAGLGGRWSHSAIFGVLIVVLVYRPEGLITKRNQVKINI